MPVARSLPATLAPRFAGAERLLATTESGSFELVVAARPMLRLRGLAGLEERELVPLLFPRCRSLHTLWMRAPIDIVWLEHAEDAVTVLDVTQALPARRLARAPRGIARRRSAALELAAGEAEAVGLQVGSAMTVRT